jgi:predicted kinase
MTTGRDWTASEWTADVEPLITEIEMAVLRHELSQGNQVVIDNTNIHAELRAPYVELAKEFGKTVGCIFLALPLELCQERNRARSRTIPEHILVDFHQSMKMPTLREGLDFVQVTNRSFNLH